MNTGGEHHLHLRKRIYRAHEPYPHPNKHVRRVDEFAYVVGVFSPLMTLPQLYTIYIEKNAAGISLVSWCAFAVGSLFWLYYGILHKEKPIIISQMLWVTCQILIVIGTALYR